MRALGFVWLCIALLTTASWGQVNYEIYQVCPGDTVHNVASRFGVSPERIQKLNGLAAPAELVPGEPLVIVLPDRPAAEAQAPSAGGREVPPRFAFVVGAAPITSEPEGGRLYYEAGIGTQVIVSAERGDHWGVIMIDGSTGWVRKSAVELTDQELDPRQIDIMLQGGRPDIVQEALRYLGTPYHYGGNLPYNADCSLLVQVVFASRGVSLPRTAAEQFDVGVPVNYSQLLPGDRLYFISKSGRINHTGVYIGSGQFVHASSRRGCVAVDRLRDRVYWPRFVGARRS